MNKTSAAVVTADRLGRVQVGIVYGWVFFAHQIGAASAAWLGGVARDGYGDYTLAFMTAGVVAIAAGFLALGIRTRAGRCARRGWVRRRKQVNLLRPMDSGRAALQSLAGHIRASRGARPG